ncbi:mitogen-activated protein kinase kinase kinase 7-like [Drosophila hydei]|uniref:Mitogen-activated protein kinase kinase kinase 7-like n=1 Tax=Drosophila hydei TaxID=7224 RepID=A0A6J1LPA4_DROHY|nr:mitogen-activated protein kinase kinase kinase 7-like [Drosophila hydei]
MVLESKMFDQRILDSLYKCDIDGHWAEKTCKVEEKEHKIYAKALKKLYSDDSEFLKGVEELKAIEHDNILKIDLSKGNILVMQFAELGSLYNYLHGSNVSMQLSDIVLLNYMKQCVMGINALHKNKILHRNLSTRNLFLFDAYYTLKIRLDPTQIYQMKISAYTAPELLKLSSHSTLSDVYSFGIILWETMSGKIPFEGMASNEIACLILNGGRPSLENMKAYDFIETIKTLIEQCWDEDPNKRPTVNILELLLSYDYCKFITLPPIIKSDKTQKSIDNDNNSNIMENK